jgi:sugar/nucleoside kinase (ribokinase family)
MTGAIAVLGEAILDLISDSDEVYQASPGGSPLKVAVTAARLGTPTYTRVDSRQIDSACF